MTPAYEPRPGSAAYRVLGHLETLPPLAEMSTAALAEASGVSPTGLQANLQAALDAGLVFRRQKGFTHQRAPYFWSLFDHAPATNGGGVSHPNPETEPAAGRQASTPKREAAPRPATELGAIHACHDACERPACVRGRIAATAPTGLRVALWSDGAMEIVRSAGEFVERLTLKPDETRVLVAYLERLAEGEGQ